MSRVASTVSTMQGPWWGVITASEVPALAAAVLDPKRQRPIIVVTTSKYTEPDNIPQVTLDEAEELRDAIGDIADIAIVATGGISFALEAALPDHWHIFNGACRSYPAGILADPDIRRSPLRRRRSWEVASEQVISDALGHALAAGVLNEKPKGSISMSATVKGFLLDGEQALADVGTPMPAVVWRDMTSPGIPLDWLIAKGSTVPGELDRDHNRFVLRRHAFAAKDFLAAYPHGSITLALVDKVSSGSAALRVHPDLSITVRRSDVSSNPLDVLDLFLVEGEVVRARVVHLSTGQPHLRLSDVDEDEPVLAAVAVVEGGTPWLVEDRTLPAVPEPLPIEEPPNTANEQPGDELTLLDESPSPTPATTPVRPMPGPGTRPAASATAAPQTATSPNDGKTAVQSMSMKISALNAEVERLRREATQAESLRQHLDLTKRTLRDTRVELGEARASIANLKSLHKKAVDELRKARKGQPMPTPDDGPRERRQNWPNDELWLRNEIQLAWIERVPGFDKLRFPLPADYLIGPRFAESMSSLDDGQFDKAMKCVVDVLTDRAKDLASRDLHRLRTGDGGSDAPRVRVEDGAVAWRAAVEINVASARRLHYWAVGNQIELSQVAVHDDMEA